MHEFEQGFSVREKPWHGLGEVLADYPGRDEAMRLAGHDFEIVEYPVHVEVPVADGFPVMKQASGFKALAKSGDGAILNVVKNSYEVVQNGVLWDIVDAIVAQPNVKYETAGVLRGGAVLWVLALLDEPGQIPGDNSLIYPYIAASTTHDGSGACKAQNIETRIVCMNTYAAASAESARSGREFVFRHTKNVADRIEDAKMALAGVRAGHEAFLDLARELAEIRVTPAQTKLFLSEFIPMPEQALISKRVEKNVLDVRKLVESVLASETTADAHRESGYGLFMAGTEYLDHLRRAHTAETRFGRSVLRQESAKNQLAGLIREVAAA